MLRGRVVTCVRVYLHFWCFMWLYSVFCEGFIGGLRNFVKDSHRGLARTSSSGL